MADTQTTESTVKLTAEFEDGTEYTLTQRNPITAPLVDKIMAFSRYVKEQEILISSKSNAKFSRIKQATKHITKETNFDLG